jgi:hypothetical protein
MKFMRRAPEVTNLRTTKKAKALLQKAEELFDRAETFKNTPRNLKINIKNLKGEYLYQKYTVDDSCSLDCNFLPQEEKPVITSGLFQEALALKPYSVSMIILKKTPQDATKSEIDTGKPVEKPADKAIDTGG